MAHEAGFLWPEERKLMHWLVREQNKAFTWDDTERGKFKEEYFLPVEIPTCKGDRSKAPGDSSEN